MEAAGAELERAEQRHTETTAPLLARLQSIRETCLAADPVRRRLSDTCLDDDVLARLDVVRGQSSKAHQEAQAIRRDLDDCQALARSEWDKAERAKAVWRGDEQVQENLDRAAEHDARAKSLARRSPRSTNRSRPWRDRSRRSATKCWCR